MSEKVMRAVEELDYQPDILAQSLRRRETLSVGFVVGDISNPLFAEIVTGVESTLHTNGYSMLLTNSLGDPLLEAAHIALLSQRRVDGLVISVLDETHPEPLGAGCASSTSPSSCSTATLPAEIPVSRVLSDHRSGMKAAGLHLLDLGHRRIGLIAGAAVRPALERRAGLEEAFAERGLPADLHGRRGRVLRRARRCGDAAAARSPRAADGGHRRRQPADARRAPSRRPSAGSRSGGTCRSSAATTSRSPTSSSRRSPSSVATTSRWAGRRPSCSSPGCATTRRPSDVVLPTEFVARPSCGPPPR